MPPLRRTIKHLSSSTSVWLVTLILLSSMRNAAAWTTSRGIQSHRHRAKPRNGQALLPRRESRCILMASSTEDNNDDGEVQSPKQLRQALWEMSRIPSQKSPSPDVAYSVPDLEGFNQDANVPGESIRAKQDIPGYPGRIQNGTDDESDEEDVQQAGPTEDGYFLNESEYLNSRSHLNPDGSLNLGGENDYVDATADEEYQVMTENLLRMQSPNVPTSFLSSNTDEPTMESLLKQTPHDPSATSEELHKQVFEQEEGFLKQSKVFLKSLGADGFEAAAEAARLRRGAEYRKRQEEAIQKLYQEIDEFEAHLNDNPPKSAEEKCFKCGCALSPQELERFRSTKVPASRRLCSVCYGDLLVAKSDKSFFRDDTIAPKRRNMPSRMLSGGGRPVNRDATTTTMRRRDYSRPPVRRRSISPPPQPSSIQRTPPVSEGAKPRIYERQNRAPIPDDENNEIEVLKREVKKLQDEVHHIKDDAANNDDYSISDETWNETEYEEPQGTWSQVIDPDSGDVFYWNEETEEMKWEL